MGCVVMFVFCGYPGRISIRTCGKQFAMGLTATLPQPAYAHGADREPAAGLGELLVAWVRAPSRGDVLAGRLWRRLLHVCWYFWRRGIRCLFVVCVSSGIHVSSSPQIGFMCTNLLVAISAVAHVCRNNIMAL